MSAHLLRMMMGAAATGTLTRTFLQLTGLTADASSYMFAAQNLGTAASDRTIVACVGIRNAATPAISSVTIAGITATVAHTVDSGAGTRTAIYYAAVPTGTSGSVVVTLGATSLRCAISLYSLTGGTVAVAATASATADNTAASVASTSGRVVIAATGMAATSGATSDITWTGPTRDAVSGVESSYWMSTASRESAASETVNCTPDGNATDYVSTVATAAVTLYAA